MNIRNSMVSEMLGCTETFFYENGPSDLPGEQPPLQESSHMEPIGEDEVMGSAEPALDKAMMCSNVCLAMSTSGSPGRAVIELSIKYVSPTIAALLSRRRVPTAARSSRRSGP